MALRARSSGRSTRMRRSKRPGRSSAGSRTSGRLVAARTTTSSFRSKPSISESSWFSVCSRSSLPPPGRCRATTDGVDLVDEHDGRRALLGLLEEIAHPSRAHADEHLDELRAADGEERDARFAGDRAGQQRLARARRPDQENAAGNLSSQPLEPSGSFRNSTISRRSDLAAFSPATSSNFTFTEVALSNLRLWFFMSPPSGPPAPSIPLARLEIQDQAAKITTQGSSVKRNWRAKGCRWLLTLMRTPFCRSSGRSCESLGATLVWRSLTCRPSSVSDSSGWPRPPRRRARPTPPSPARSIDKAASRRPAAAGSLRSSSSTATSPAASAEESASSDARDPVWALFPSVVGCRCPCAGSSASPAFVPLSQ